MVSTLAKLKLGGSEAETQWPTLSFPKLSQLSDGRSPLCDRCLTLMWHVIINFGDGTQWDKLDIPHSDLQSCASSWNVPEGPCCAMCTKTRVLFEAARESERMREDLRDDPASWWIVHWTQHNGPSSHDTHTMTTIWLRARHRNASHYQDFGGFVIHPDLVQRVKHWTRMGKSYEQEENAGDYPIIVDLLNEGKAGHKYSSMLSSGPVSMVRSWMQECAQTHGNCNRIFASNGQDSSAQAWFPDRLVEVTVGNDPEDSKYTVINARLALKSDPTDFRKDDLASGVLYISLSHCWGPNPDPSMPMGGRADTVLTESKLAMWCKDIPLEALPLTFQEAVITCAAIGFKYIWIDSLCIIQDSIEDWQQQSAVMGDVYKYAWLNIAAMSSISDYEGFIRKDRDTRVDFGFRTSFSDVLEKPVGHRNEKGQQCILLQGTAKLIWQDSRDVPRSNHLNAPLFSRAWVFQERNLSRRTLGFTSTAVRFVCDGFTKCEQPEWWNATLSQGELRLTLQAVLGIATSAASTVERDGRAMSVEAKAQLILTLQQKFDQCWRNAVATYSRCKLTKHTDRLIAFGSIARELVSPNLVLEKKRYLAGLWDENLVLQLVWLASGDKSTNAERYQLGEPGYVAPSWSWASIESPVSLRSMYPAPGSTIALASVIASDVELATDFEYGSVKAGWLRMSGHLRAISGSLLKTRRTLSLVDAQTGASFYFSEDTAKAYAMCSNRREVTNVLWLPLTLAYSHDARPTVEDSFSGHGLVATAFESTKIDDRFLKAGEKVYRRLGTCNFGRTFSRIREDKILMSLGIWPESANSAEMWKGLKLDRDQFEEFVLV